MSLHLSAQLDAQESRGWIAVFSLHFALFIVCVLRLADILDLGEFSSEDPCWRGSEIQL